MPCVVLVSILYAATAFAAADSACRIADSVEVNSLSKFQVDAYGMCGVTAPKILLSQFACSAERCTNPDSTNLSTAALATTAYRAYGPEQSRSPDYVLVAAQVAGAIPLESCQPLSQFNTKSMKPFSPDQNVYSTLGYNQDTVRIAMALQICKTHPTAICNMGTTNIDQIYQKLHGQNLPLPDVPELLTFMPESNCQKKSLPAFEVKTEPKFSAENVKAQIENNHPILFSACLTRNSAGSGPCARGNDHASVVVGARSICCGANCRSQFKLADPQGAKWLKSDKDGWVDERELRQFNPDGMTWLVGAAPGPGGAAGQTPAAK